MPRGVISQRNFTESCQVWTLHLGQLFFHKKLTKLSQFWTFKLERKVVQKFDRTESLWDFMTRTATFSQIFDKTESSLDFRGRRGD